MGNTGDGATQRRLQVTEVAGFRKSVLDIYGIFPPDLSTRFQIRNSCLLESEIRARSCSRYFKMTEKWRAMTMIGYVRYETQNKLSIQAVLHGIFNSWPLASCSWPIRCPNTIYQCFSNLFIAYNWNYTERTRTTRYCKYYCLLSGYWSYFCQLAIVNLKFHSCYL